MPPRIRSSWPLLVVLAVVLASLVELWPELAIGHADLNDEAYHFPIVARMADDLAHGGNPIDTWLSQWTLGYAVPRTYQPLGHLAVALLHATLFRGVDLLTFFIWFRTLLLVAFPLTMYASARILRLPAPAAAAVAVVSPFLATGGWFGLEWGSYAWRGSGLFTQLCAMHLLPLALATCFRAMREGRRLWLGALLLSLTFAAHLVYGYIGALSVVLLAFLPDVDLALPRRLVRLVVVGLLSGLTSLWLLAPLFTDRQIINHSRWEDAWKWDSIGPRRVLGMAFGGGLLDEGRAPVLTLLALAGLVACAFAWRRKENEESRGDQPVPPPRSAEPPVGSPSRAPLRSAMRFHVLGRSRDMENSSVERFVLAGSLLWLLLFAGRPQWGPLLKLVGLGADVPLHRLIGGVHIFLMFAAGIGLWTLARLTRDVFRVPRLGVAVLCVGVMVPVLLERHEWCKVNREWGVENLRAVEAERADVDGLIAACRARGGRVYPGLAGSWGANVKVGSVPLYSLLSTARIPTVAFLFHAMSLTGDTMVHFDDSRPSQYRAFGITTVTATDEQQLPDFLQERARFGRFRLLDAPGRGFFDVVGIAASMPCDRLSFHDVVLSWMQSDWPDKLQYLALDLAARPPPEVPRLSAGAALPEVQAALLGRVVEETRDDEIYRAKVEVVRPAWALFKMTFSPRWRFEVDGAPQRIVHVAPGFMAVRIGAGSHDLRCEYAPGRGRLVLLLVLAPAVLVVAFLAERKGLVSAAESIVDARWRPFERVAGARAWLCARPRATAALMLLALAVPLCLPLLRGELTSGHDHYSYLPRLAEFHENVRHGILLPRWAPDLGSGHGQPLFVFAPPMLMALAEIPHLAGLGLVWSINLALVLLVVASGLAMWRFASFHLGREGGLLAAAAYLWAPYFASDLYVRHALAEFTAFAFYPLALDGISRLAATGRRRHAAVAAAGIAGVLLSHPPAALLFVPLAGAFALFEAARRRSGAVLVRECGALALGVGLSATAWLPALAERSDVKMDRLLEEYLRYSNHFVFPSQLVWSPWGFGLSLAGPDDGMSFSLGWVHLLLAVAAIAGLVALRWLGGGFALPRAGVGTAPSPVADGASSVESIDSAAPAVAVDKASLAVDSAAPAPAGDAPQAALPEASASPPSVPVAPDALGTALFFAASVVAYAFLMTAHAAPIWDALRLLQFVEFPWRMLAPAALSLAFVVGALVPALEGRRWVAWLALGLLVIANLGHAWPESSEKIDESQWSAKETAAQSRSVLTREEYEPRSVGESQGPTDERAAFVAGSGEVREQEWLPDRATLSVASPEAATLELRVYQFPGWTAFVDGREVPIVVVPTTGYMRVDVPAGEHAVLLAFLRTPVEKAALGMALASLLATLALAAAWPRRVAGRARPAPLAA